MFRETMSNDDYRPASESSNTAGKDVTVVESFCYSRHSETQVSGRLGMSGGRSPRLAQNPLLGERRKTLSITHHALSPPPSHHHLYIIHLINWLQRFYRIIMSLKRPFVPKSDVKQWFTTTTTTVTVVESFLTSSVLRILPLSHFLRPQLWNIFRDEFWATLSALC